MPRLHLRRGQRRNPLVWIFAIICAILAINIIIAGVIIITIYLIYQPKMPYMKVSYAHLNKLNYDQSGHLDTEISLSIVAENNNTKTNARFSQIAFNLMFHGMKIAELRADPFDVPKNSSLPLNYYVRSSSIPLDESGMEALAVALKQDRVQFDLKGQARTHWRVGIFISLRFWTHLSCHLEFFLSNQSSIGLDCSSKTH